MAVAGPPEWVILGAPKAGTTTLAGWLGGHPQGFVAPVKEVAYFNRFFERGPEWYARQFAGAAPGARRGEATPAYLYFDDALDRLAAASPHARLIVILREPAARIWSHYWYNRGLGLEVRSLSRALAAERRDPTNAPYGLELGYLACTRYVDRLAAVTERFDREQLLVLMLDDLQSDPVTTFAAACRHVGIDDTVLPPAGALNVGRRARSALLQHLLMRARAGRWPLQIGPRLTRLNATGERPPPMPASVAAQLRAELAPDTLRLADWLGHDLPAGWVSA